MDPGSILHVNLWPVPGFSGGSKYSVTPDYHQIMFCLFQGVSLPDEGDDLREVVQKLVFGLNVMVQTSHMAEVVGDFFL